MAEAKENWRVDPERIEKARESYLRIQADIEQLHLLVQALPRIHCYSNGIGLPEMVNRANLAVSSARSAVARLRAAVKDGPTETYLGNMAAFGEVY